MRALIELHLERSEVGIEQDVGDDDLGLQLGMFAHLPRVLNAAHVVPGPAVEAALLHVGDVVGNQVVAQGIPFIGGAPQFARWWGGWFLPRSCGCP